MAKRTPIVSNILKTPKFVDDLPTKNVEKTSKYVEILVPLKKHKNKWAMIATFEKGSAANGVASYLRQFPAVLPGKFEFAVRKLEEEYGLFAKFVG